IRSDDLLYFLHPANTFFVFFFFFSSRRRHTRYIGDWSSDVCSSDLRCAVKGQSGRQGRKFSRRHHRPHAKFLRLHQNSQTTQRSGRSRSRCGPRRPDRQSRLPRHWSNHLATQKSGLSLQSLQPRHSRTDNPESLFPPEPKLVPTKLLRFSVLAGWAKCTDRATARPAAKSPLKSCLPRLWSMPIDLHDSLERPMPAGSFFKI